MGFIFKYLFNFLICVLSFNFIFSYDVDLGKTDILVLDEIKIYNIALNDSQVKELYLDQFKSLELNSVVIDYNSTTGELDLDVTFPFIEKSSNLMCYFYYSKK
jgi:hypothetical protein